MPRFRRLCLVVMALQSMRPLVAVVFCVALAGLFAYIVYRQAVDTSALHEAVYRSNAAEVIRLLSTSRDIDQRNRGTAFGIHIRQYPLPYETDVTALYVAAAKADPELVNILLRNGANPNLEFRGYETILHRALVNLSPSIDFHGHGLSSEPAFTRTEVFEVVRLLVTHGAEIDRRRYPESETPLEMAYRLGEHEVAIKMSMWSSARMDLPNMQTNSP